MDYKHYLRPKDKGIKLHLGCGDYWFENYVNIDIGIYGGTDLIWDLTQKLPFQDNVIERIECYEVLEHLELHEVHSVLEEWKRLLIDEGTVRISVPDMEKLIEEFEKNKDKIIEEMFGVGPGLLRHKWGYTKQSIVKLFGEHAFKEIRVEQGFLEERPEEPKLILSCNK